MRVAVLGCGPAGLMAAMGVLEEDPTARVVILSKKQRSTIGGAQYLHIPVPGITQAAPDGYVLFQKRGTAENYAKRVYGDTRADTSWKDYDEGYQPIWDMRKAYDALWEVFRDYIEDVEIKQEEFPAITSVNELVISSIPAKVICANPEHVFRSQDVWITPGAACGDMTIIYNGTTVGKHLPDWYRESRIFGHASREWSIPQADKETIHVRKPLYTDCDCWMNIKRVGRFGRWQKGQLISSAYEDARRMTREML